MPVQDTNNLPQSDARHHALNIAQSLREVAQHAAEDIVKVKAEEGRLLLQQTADRLNEMAAMLEAYGVRAQQSSPG